MGISLLTLVIVVMMVCPLLGITFLTLGIRISRGRRICWKCEYDLTGLPDESTACPECGRDLSWLAHRDRVQIRRRRGLLIAGWVLALMPILGPLGWLAFTLVMHLR
jgi:uncharacterized paraquat-inducible protein A